MGFGWESHRRIWTGPCFAAQLRDDSKGLDLRTCHTVLGIDGDVLRVQSEHGIREMSAKRIILATGTRETPRAPRFVGGSRPSGVMTTGALQANDKFNERVIGRVPMGGWGEPEDFAGIAVYLASRAARFHTGDALVIDGGYTIY